MSDEADDDIEDALAAAKPRTAPSHLRAAVIAAVAAELDARSPQKPRWKSWIERTVAASVLFSAATNLAVSLSEARRMAAWDKRPAARSSLTELAAAIASVSDEKRAAGVVHYLRSQLPAGARPASTAIHRAVEEIESWADGEPLAERSRADEETQDRI